MAKCTIYLKDNELEFVDKEARRRGVNRSVYIKSVLFNPLYNDLERNNQNNNAQIAQNNNSEIIECLACMFHSIQTNVFLNKELLRLQVWNAFKNPRTDKNFGTEGDRNCYCIDRFSEANQYAIKEVNELFPPETADKEE